MENKKGIVIAIIIIFIVFGLAIWAIVGSSSSVQNNVISKNIINNIIENETTETKENNAIDNQTQEIQEIVEQNENAKTIDTTSYEKYTFTNEYGDGTKNIEIEANELEIASGYSGASSNVYYVKDNELFHLELSNLSIEKLATGIKSIEKGLDGITARTQDNYNVLIDDTYITYEK